MDEGVGGACPLCGDQFDGHLAYRRHLAKVHDLRDEPGTRTTLPPPAEAAEAPAPPPEGRRIGKKPNLAALPDVWEPTDPDLARRVGRQAVAVPDPEEHRRRQP